MKIPLTFLYLASCLFICCQHEGALAQDARPAAGEADIASIRQDINVLQAKYKNVSIPEDSPDLKLFDRLRTAAHTTGQFIEELIDLTAISETQPQTTERFTPLSLSPAGGILCGLGITDPSVSSAIGARLAEGNLSELQSNVLNELLWSLEMRDKSKKDPTIMIPRMPKQWPTAEQHRAALNQSAAAPDSAVEGSTPKPVAPVPLPAMHDNAFARPITPAQYLFWTLAVLAGIGAITFLIKRKTEG